MRGSLYVSGVTLILLGLTLALTNLTGTFQPWLWVAAAGLLLLVVTSLTDVELIGPDHPDGVFTTDVAEREHRQ
jgi:hypothetical protein